MCYLCPVFFMLSRLFTAALWSPTGKGADLLALVVFLSLFHMVSWVRCRT